MLLEQELQLQGQLVAQIEETVARMMGMETQFGTVRRYIALGAHHEGSGTAVTELKFALGAGEMHATTPESRVTEKFVKRRLDRELGSKLPCQRISKLALGTIDAIMCQMLLNTLCLQFRIIFTLPLQVGSTAGAFVLFLPGLATLGTGHRTTVGADQTLLLGTSKESRGALYAPFEIGILEQCAIT